jgi:hypothetical protein
MAEHSGALHAQRKCVVPTDKHPGRSPRQPRPAAQAPRSRGYRILFPLLIIALSFSLTACPKPDHGKEIAEKIASQIAGDSALIATETGKLASFTESLYRDKATTIPKVDRSKYGFEKSGVFYKKNNDGGASLWISGVVPITEQIKEIAYLTEPLDAELKRICEQLPVVVQAYYNDEHSLNRIYPWMDTLTQYQPGMNIPKFNFYYLADQEHNPKRNVVWVDEPYVDPAGRGWMVSAIAPVYGSGEDGADYLLGVVGLDITLESISKHYVENSKLPVAVIAGNGVLVAASEDAIAILEMPRPKDHRYMETVKGDTFKPDDYNVARSSVRAVRELVSSLSPDAAPSRDLDIGQKHYKIHVSRLNDLGFTVVVFVKR